MKEKLSTGFYFLVSSVHILSVIIGADELQGISKIMLMPTLIYLVFVLAAGMVTQSRLMLVGGLICSWVGDILLVNDGESYFLGGLGAFLVAQILYSFVMHKSTFGVIQFRLKPLIPVLVLGALLLIILIPSAGSFGVPIAIYSLAILVMVSLAVLRLGLTSEDSHSYALVGAVMFCLSDSFIAIDKFVFDIPLANFFIMTSYVSAQYLIVRGIMAHPGGGR